MIRALLVAGALLAWSRPLPAQDAEETKSIPLRPLLVAAPVPAGLEVSTQEIKDGGKVLGLMVLVSRPGQVARVIARIENRDLSGPPARRAAVKGYVNGFAAGPAEQGFRVGAKAIPDMTNLTSARPVPVGLVFANDEGKKVWTHQEISFTDRGFAAQVVADGPATLASPRTWAKTIKPR